MKITFTDKTLIDNRPDLSDMEKVTGGNINEIKNVVNTNAVELDTIKTSVESFGTEITTLKENDTKQDKKIEYLAEEQSKAMQEAAEEATNKPENIDGTTTELQ